jgi:hypothetical protein
MRVGDGLKLPLVGVAAVTSRRLVDGHRRPILGMRIVTVRATHVGPVVGRTMPLLHMGAAMAFQTKVPLGLRPNARVRIVAGRAIELGGMTGNVAGIPAGDGRVTRRALEREGNAHLMRVDHLLQPLFVGMTTVAEIRRNGSQMVRAP